MAVPSLISRLVAGDVRALARAISLVEDESPAAADLLAGVHRHAGRARLVGITGPPGAGKSSLVSALIAAYRASGLRVAVLAVDPSSPFSGGAILGDRIRMQAYANDPGVFIRSMATRGHLGGLARATADAAVLADAAGFDLVLIETVGVGQDEVDIVRTADVSVVVTVPGTGDDVQAIKAGLMEIADIFVVNKADREGADRAVAALEAMIALDERPAATWRPPVLRTVATDGTGVSDVIAAIDRHRAAAAPAETSRRRARVEWRLRDVVSRETLRRLETAFIGPGEWTAAVERIVSGEADPHSIAAAWLSRMQAPIAGRVHHVGVATADEARSLEFFQDVLGLEPDAGEDVPSQRVRVRFLLTGDTKIELIAATSDDSPVARFIEKRGPGLHHVALRVDDLESTLAYLEARGVRLIDSSPRPGAHGTRVAFVHPASTGGVLVELIESPAGDDAHR